MNEEKSLLNKVRIVLGLVRPEKLEAATLADGTMVEADSFEIGNVLYVVSETGEKTPAPAGEHTLADGSVVVVDETGVITEIRVPEIEEEPAEEMMSGVTKEEFDAAMSRIEAIEASIQGIETAVLEALETLKSQNEALTSKIEKLSAEPAAQPIKSKGIVPKEENALKGLLANRKK